MGQSPKGIYQNRRLSQKTIKKVRLFIDRIFLLFDDDTYCNINIGIEEGYGESYTKLIQEKFQIWNVSDATYFELCTTEEAEDIIAINKRKAKEDEERHLILKEKEEFKLYKKLHKKYSSRKNIIVDDKETNE